MIWGSDVFPAAADPKGDPEKWSIDELKRWLNKVGCLWETGQQAADIATEKLVCK